MPKGTKVDKCFTSNKKKMGSGKAAAICQKSTNQSLKTGKPLTKKRKK
jgi:hypothetical protein